MRKDTINYQAYLDRRTEIGSVRVVTRGGSLMFVLDENRESAREVREAAEV